MSGTVKHTTGPWSLDLSDDRFIVRDGNDDVVADCWNGSIGDDGETPLDTCEPNAHLIAAAPDMLVALRCARADCYMPPHVAAHVDAAIARAEGRS